MKKLFELEQVKTFWNVIKKKFFRNPRNNASATKGQVLTYVDDVTSAWTDFPSVLTFKGVVDTYDDLTKIANPSVGDVYCVKGTEETSNIEYFWDGISWEYMGSMISGDGFVKKTGDTMTGSLSIDKGNNYSTKLNDNGLQVFHDGNTKAAVTAKRDTFTLSDSAGNTVFRVKTTNSKGIQIGENAAENAIVLGTDMPGSGARNSIAIGINAFAPEQGFAFGTNNRASATEGGVIGHYNTVIGSSAFAGGGGNETKADQSIIFGSNNTISVGEACAVFGSQNEIRLGTDDEFTFENENYDESDYYGAETFVEGSLNVGVGSSAHAEGNQTMALGRHSHSEGYLTVAYSSDAHAEGDSTKAVGKNTHAEGDTTVAIGEGSHAEGKETRAEGQWSHAEGEVTKAISDASHAEGCLTIAQGEYAHAEGYDTQALKDSSHAEGAHTKAKAYCGHAQGYYTETGTKIDGQCVMGSYNIANDTSMLIVGGGDYNKRKNLFTVNTSGTATVAANPVNAMDVVTQQYLDAQLSNLIKVDSIQTLVDEHSGKTNYYLCEDLNGTESTAVNIYDYQQGMTSFSGKSMLSFTVAYTPKIYYPLFWFQSQAIKLSLEVTLSKDTTKITYPVYIHADTPTVATMFVIHNLPSGIDFELTTDDQSTSSNSMLLYLSATSALQGWTITVTPKTYKMISGGIDNLWVVTQLAETYADCLRQKLTAFLVDTTTSIPNAISTVGKVYTWNVLESSSSAVPTVTNSDQIYQLKPTIFLSVNKTYSVGNYLNSIQCIYNILINLKNLLLLS